MLSRCQIIIIFTSNSEFYILDLPLLSPCGSTTSSASSGLSGASESDSVMLGGCYPVLPPTPPNTPPETHYGSSTDQQQFHDTSNARLTETNLSHCVVVKASSELVLPHECKICQKRFKLSRHLDDHVRHCHSDERPFR